MNGTGRTAADSAAVAAVVAETAAEGLFEGVSDGPLLTALLRVIATAAAVLPRACPAEGLAGAWCNSFGCATLIIDGRAVHCAVAVAAVVLAGAISWSDAREPSAGLRWPEGDSSC